MLNVTEQSLAMATQLLLDGQVVAFPTETVYGLGAWAFSESGVARIYEAKGRPSDNPLIVHIAPGADLHSLVSSVPPAASALMQRFWPGPLTLIMPKGPAISPRITGGLDTVAIRMPAHPAAIRLLEVSGLPLVAPSANSSGKPSPTTARHVWEDLQGRIPLILDGGPCGVGLESTVLDLTESRPVILRPGAITQAMLEAVIGPVEVDPAVRRNALLADHVKPKAPGMKYRHYAPKGKLIITDATPEQMRAWLTPAAPQERVGVVATRQYLDKLQPDERQVTAICLGDQDNTEELAAHLFGALRKADQQGLTLIYGQALPAEGLGEALMNRFIKASSQQIWINRRK